MRITVMLAFAAVLGLTWSGTPLAQNQSSAHGIVERLKAIREIGDSLERLTKYDALVDSLDAPSTPAADEKPALSPEEQAFVKKQARELKRVADDMIEVAELAEKLKTTFDDSEKANLATRGMRRMEEVQKWQKSKDTLRFFTEHGVHLGDGFYAVFLGRRTKANMFMDQELFLFGLHYAGERRFKVAKVSWSLEDLLGDSVSAGNGKFDHGDFADGVNIVSIEKSMFSREGTAHVTEWADAVLVKGSAPEVIWE